MAGDYDRTVHANVAEGGQVVRYERSGKYYLEYPKDPTRKRRHLKLAEAVALAVEGTPHLGRVGSLAFDAAVRKAQAARDAPTA